MRRVVLLGGAVTAALTLLAASAAQAQAEDTGPAMTLFGWSVSGSLSGQITPDYMGAKTYSLGPGGSLQFHRPGVQPTFGAPDDSPGLQLLGDKTLSGGVVVRGRSSRDDDDALQGIHKLDFAFEPGVYAEWWPLEGLR